MLLFAWGFSMKKFFLLLTLLLLASISLFTEANTTSDGFWGIEWGTSFNVVESSLIDKGVTILAKDQDTLMGEGVFSGRESTILVRFYDNQMSSAMVIFDYEKDRVQYIYDEIVELLTEKYGEPTDNVREFEWPYNEGDDDEEMAIAVGKALIYSEWILSDGNRIKVIIGTRTQYKPQVALLYSHKELSEKADERDKERILGDL